MADLTRREPVLLTSTRQDGSTTALIQYGALREHAGRQIVFVDLSRRISAAKCQQAAVYGVGETWLWLTAKDDLSMLPPRCTILLDEWAFMDLARFLEARPADSEVLGISWPKTEEQQVLPRWMPVPPHALRMIEARRT